MLSLMPLAHPSPVKPRSEPRIAEPDTRRGVALRADRRTQARLGVCRHSSPPQWSPPTPSDSTSMRRRLGSSTGEFHRFHCGAAPLPARYRAATRRQLQSPIGRAACVEVITHARGPRPGRDASRAHAQVGTDRGRGILGAGLGGVLRGLAFALGGTGIVLSATLRSLCPPPGHPLFVTIGERA